MTMPDNPSDIELLEALDAAIDAAQPMPPSVVAWGRGAWDTRALDAEFAALVGDSLIDEELAESAYAIRGVAQPRMLSFAAGETAIELEVEQGSDGAQSVVGQLIPPGPATVTFEQPAGTRDAHADGAGCFAFDDVAAGPARLRIRRPPDELLTSAWFRL
jgi:hypothetical protein